MATLKCPTPASATSSSASSSSSTTSLRRKPLPNSLCFTTSTHLSPTIGLSSTQPFSPFKTLKHPTFKIQSSSTPITSDLTNTSSPPQSLKSRLNNGETLYGLFLLSFSPILAEIAGFAGYDFVVIDMEHGHGGISEALPCLHALAATRTPAILRLPESNPTWAKKALDLGPQGIMFPMIESSKMARKAVSYCRFPPKGVRGSAHTVVRASNYGLDAGYLSNFEEELLIMCQVESEHGLEEIKEMAAVDGVDCIQMGPLDLSASMGYLWDPGNKKVRQVMRQAEKAVLGTEGGRSDGAYLAGFAMPHDGPEDLRMRGYQMVSGAVDVGLFRNAVVEDVKKFKTSLMMESDDDEAERDNIDGEDVKYWSE